MSRLDELIDNLVHSTRDSKIKMWRDCLIEEEPHGAWRITTMGGITTVIQEGADIEATLRAAAPEGV
jgi:hypothetical protein